MHPPGSIQSAYLGIDVGTSSVKALLVDETGRELASAAESLLLEASVPLQAEQDAAHWWQATVGAVARCLAAAGGVHVAAVGLTGQKHALLGLDTAGRPVAPAMTWADGRARQEARHVREVFPAAGRRVGRQPLPGLFLPKWLWLRAHQPEAAARVDVFLFAKDYIRFRLTGVVATDRTEASASQLYDYRRNDWSRTLTGFFDLDLARLPAVLEPTAHSGAIHAAAAAQTGLPVGTPVGAGAGDNEAAALSVGGIEPGHIAVTLGTSATLLGWNRIRSSASGLTWNRHVLAGGYAATGTVLSAGRALRWFRDIAYPEGARVVELLAEAEASAPSPAPLVFLPSLVGARSPVPDPEATGAFVGLRAVHRRPDLARAVIEGLSLSMAEILVQMRSAGVVVSELRVTGGGAGSGFWRQLLAAASGTPVRVAGRVSGAALGAAMLARSMETGEGLPDLAALWVHPGAREMPDPVEAKRLAPLATLLCATRNALRGVRTR